MRRYRITYRDTDPGCPLFTWTCHAYDVEHALDRFWGSGDGDNDWTVIKVERLP